MTRQTRIKLRIVIISAVVSAVIGMAYAGGVHGAPLVNGAAVGVIFGGMITAFFMFVAPGLRRFRFVVALALKTAALTVIMLIGLNAGIFFAGVSDHSAYFDPISLRLYWTEADWQIDFAFMLGTAAISNAIISMQELVGPARFWQFLAGRYHRPRREERIFVFLDLAGSTAIAERLGDVDFYALLQHLVHDIAPVIENYRGTIDRYIGDAVVITWLTRDAAANADCLRCLFAIADVLARNHDIYRRDFGLSPHYRAGCHVGPIVAGEIGEWRKEIVFLGDTINTAARIEEAAKQHDRDVVASAELLAAVALPAELEAIALGPYTPRGRLRPVELFAIERRG